MMEQMTDLDRETISTTPFLRVDKIFYSAVSRTSIVILFTFLLIPFLSPWVKSPFKEPPKTLDAYFTGLVPLLTIWSLFAIIPLTDYLIRKTELTTGTKKVKELTLANKWTTKRWTVLLFKPFHISIFRYFFRLRILNRGDKVIAELSSLNRIIDFRKLD